MRSRLGGAVLGSFVAITLACSAQRESEEETPLPTLDTGTSTTADTGSGSDTFVLPDTESTLDVPADTPISKTECRIATLGEPGSAGVGDIFAKWLDTSGGKAAASLKDQVLTSTVLAPYKMIVAQNVSMNHAYSATEAKVLSDWVKAGGGFMTLTGFADSTEVVNVNLLLAPFGMSYDSTPILYGGGTTVPVDTWLTHPVTKGITKIGVDNGYGVLGTGKVVARGSGSDVLEVKDVGTGHVLLWGDEWITFNSEWSAHPDYQVKQFWQNIVDWFAPGSGCKVPDPPK